MLWKIVILSALCNLPFSNWFFIIRYLRTYRKEDNYGELLLRILNSRCPLISTGKSYLLVWLRADETTRNDEGSAMHCIGLHWASLLVVPLFMPSIYGCIYRIYSRRSEQGLTGRRETNQNKQNHTSQNIALPQPTGRFGHLAQWWILRLISATAEPGGEFAKTQIIGAPRIGVRLLLS